MGKTKIVTVYENKYLTDNLDEDEIIFAINVADVQFLAEQKLGRKLIYEEMYSVKKGVEWGMDYWDDVVKSAIGNLPRNEEDEETDELEEDDEKSE